MQTLNIYGNDYAKCQIADFQFAGIYLYLVSVCVCVCVCHDLLPVYVLYIFIEQKEVHCHAENCKCSFWFQFSFYRNPSMIVKMIHIFYATLTVNRHMKLNNKRYIGQV